MNLSELPIASEKRQQGASERYPIFLRKLEMTRRHVLPACPALASRASHRNSRLSALSAKPSSRFSFLGWNGYVVARVLSSFLVNHPDKLHCRGRRSGMSFDPVPCYAIRRADLFAVATRLFYPTTGRFGKRRYMQRCGSTERYLLYHMSPSASSHIRMTTPIR